MDISDFITQSTYNLIINDIYFCVKTATEKLFQQACTDEKKMTSKHQGNANSTELKCFLAMYRGISEEETQY